MSKVVCLDESCNNAIFRVCPNYREWVPVAQDTNKSTGSQDWSIICAIVSTLRLVPNFWIGFHPGDSVDHRSNHIVKIISDHLRSWNNPNISHVIPGCKICQPLHNSIVTILLSSNHRGSEAESQGSPGSSSHSMVDDFYIRVNMKDMIDDMCRILDMMNAVHHP